MPFRWAKGLFFVLVGLVAWNSHAHRTSFRNAHPVGWMHLTPVGETPGWSEDQWLNLELNHANIWNMNFEMIDERTGDIYGYEADFEQSSTILEMGWALTKDFAFGLEVPYANRNGGFMDEFIDQFHLVIGSDRFLRHLNDDFDNHFSVKKNGEEQLDSRYGQGVGSYKVKMKWWPLKWRSPTPGVCDCGFAVSAQGKFPVQKRGLGLSSGGQDFSGLAHLGMPIKHYSGLWMTAAITKVGRNKTFDGWPQRRWLQMYEISLDIGLSRNFGVILQARAESPFFSREHLDFVYTHADHDARLAERIASGWNSLVEWRGSESIGVRWRWGKGSQINFMLVEDWGLGDKDERDDFLYVNNAPDVAFISQWHFVF